MEHTGLQEIPTGWQENGLRGPGNSLGAGELSGDQYLMDFSGGGKEDYIVQLKNEIYEKVMGIMPVFGGHEDEGGKGIAEFIAHQVILLGKGMSLDGVTVIPYFLRLV